MRGLLIEGREVVLVGHYWKGNNLMKWIDDCEGEANGVPMKKDDAFAQWERFENPVHFKYDQEKGGKVLRREFRGQRQSTRK